MVQPVAKDWRDRLRRSASGQTSAGPHVQVVFGLLSTPPQTLHNSVTPANIVRQYGLRPRKEEDARMGLAKQWIGGALIGASLFEGAAAAQSYKPLKIGVLTDLTSVYADIGGQGNIEAAKMAIEDFGGQKFGKPIEFVSSDVQMKADVAASIARKWWENEGVDAIVDMPTS